MRTEGLRATRECSEMRSDFQPVTLGERVRQREFCYFSITEAVHRPDLVLPPHVHRYPAVTIVRDGGFGLGGGRGTGRGS